MEPLGPSSKQHTVVVHNPLLQELLIRLQPEPGVRAPSPLVRTCFLLMMCLSTAVFAPAQVLSTSGTRGRGDTTSTSVGTHGGSSGEPGRTIVYEPFFAPSSCDIAPHGTNMGAAEARAALLDKRGPLLAPIFNMSGFSIMGFSKGNWPVVIDYALEQDSLLIVVIAPEGFEPILYRIDGKKGHWQIRFQIPAALGDRPVVAQYLIRSLEATGGQSGLAHMHFHGIAAGPKAVGSVGIDNVMVGPANIHPALHESAHYSFHSISDFKSSEVAFVRVAVSNGQIIAARVNEKSTGSVSRGSQKSGDWDGKSNLSENSMSGYPPEVQEWLRDPKGEHLVQVRAWWGEKDGGDWVTAISESSVVIQ